MKTLSSYGKTYQTFSGIDMVCTFEIPMRNGKSITRVVGSLQTISYSIHNEKMPVRTIGNMNMKGFVFGNRTIAGSMVFTVFNTHWLMDFFKAWQEEEGISSHSLSDEMPPINITVSMANEYGDTAHLAIYGASFVNEGQVMSVQDMYMENTFQYYAMDIDYLSHHKKIGSKHEDSRYADLKKKKKENTPVTNIVVLDVPYEEEGKGITPTVDTIEVLLHTINTKKHMHKPKKMAENVLTLTGSAIKEIPSREEEILSAFQHRYQEIGRKGG